MVYITINGELYHHGIKGQRWGVRRYQNPDGTLTEAGKKRLKSFHLKEVQTIANRRLRQLPRESAKIAKRGNKFNQTLDQYGPNAKKTLKEGAKYIKTKGKAIARDNIAKAEVDKILSMNLKDVSNEKVLLGAHVAKDMLINTFSTVSMASLGSPVGVFTFTNFSKAKTNLRVDRATQEKITRDAYNEAAEDIYG